jgi:hypothetical protein
MMSEDPCLAAIQVTSEGHIAAVWLAHTPRTDLVTLFDSCLFREPLNIVAEGLNARGRWVPIIWHRDHRTVADQLVNRSANMIPADYAVTGSGATAALMVRELEARIRAKRLVADATLATWREEYDQFRQTDAAAAPTAMEAFPHLLATGYAIARLDWAKRNPQGGPGGYRGPNAPRLNIV